MARLSLIIGSAALVGCAPALLRPLVTTEAATALSQVTRSLAQEFDPAVAPDGQAIAYEVAPTSEAAPRVAVMSLGGPRWGEPGTVAFTSGDVAGVEPTWQPDGSAVWFLSATPGDSRFIEMMDQGAGKPPLFADGGDVGFAGEWPAVSPNGSTVVMSVANTDVFHTGWRRARHYSRALGFTDELGSGIKVWGEGTQAAWSPDGSRLAFVRESGGHAHLFTMSAAGAEARQITDGPSDDEAPSWSPDGESIVFCSRSAAVESTQADLFTVRPDGSGMRQLTEGDRYACHPSWGRDGFVYFHVNADDRFHIWRLRPR